MRSPEPLAGSELRNIKTNSSRSAVADCVVRAEWGLTPPEQWMLAAVPSDFRESILDIGIGAGRTTGPLSQAFKKYVGVDIAEPSLEVARKRFPELDLRSEDARYLPYENEFSCIFFSFNGIDVVNFNDRMRIFRAVWKALRPGGYFIFSSHSLVHENVNRWATQFAIYELKSGSELLPVSMRKCFNRARLFWSGKIDQKAGIGVLNDPALDFGILNTYVDPDSETVRLKDSGFETLARVGERKSAPGFDEKDAWIYFLTRKLA